MHSTNCMKLCVIAYNACSNPKHTNQPFQYKAHARKSCFFCIACFILAIMFRIELKIHSKRFVSRKFNSSRDYVHHIVGKFGEEKFDEYIYRFNQNWFDKSQMIYMPNFSAIRYMEYSFSCFVAIYVSWLL